MFSVLSDNPVKVSVCPLFDWAPPVAVSTPLLSPTVAVNVSPLVAPVSATLMPAIVVGAATLIVCAPGTVITGDVVAVTAIVFAVATLPKLSLAFTVRVSEPAAPSVSDRLARSVFSVASDNPVKVSVCPLFDSAAGRRQHPIAVAHRRRERLAHWWRRSPPR